MKILLLNQAFHPDSVATSQYVTDIALYLIAQGHEVSVICDRRDYTKRDTLYPHYEEFEGIQIHRVASVGVGKQTFFTRLIDAVSYDLRAFWKLLHFPKQELVIAFTSPPLVGLQGALFCRWRGGHFVHWLMNINHEMAMEMGYINRGSLLAHLLTMIYRFTIRHAGKVIVMDRWMKERVLREHIAPDKVAIVPLWSIHPSVNQNNGQQLLNPFREKYGLQDKFTVVHSGNLSYIHPLDTVLQAAVCLKDSHEVAFIFFGYGYRERDIDQCVKAHQLTNILKLPYQPREYLGNSLGLADLHLVIMGNAASGLAHSSKIYSILATGHPYLFIGPKDSHIVGDVLDRCPFGFHIEHGDVDGFLRVVEHVKRLKPSEISYFRHNIDFVSAHFNRDRCLQYFSNETLNDMTTTQNSRH